MTPDCPRQGTASRAFRLFHDPRAMARGLRALLGLCLLPLLLAGQARAADEPDMDELIRLVETLHAAFLFSRLGVLSREENDSPYLKAARIAATRQDFVVVLEDLPAGGRDPEQCREAVDALFFDGVDAIVLDDSPCFDPESEDFADLMQGLVLQGVSALSLHTEKHVRAGALAGPADQAAPSARGAPRADGVPRAEQKKLLVLRPLAINVDTAKALGIDLSVAALLASGVVYGATSAHVDSPEP